jgi:hypothetical protein
MNSMTLAPGYLTSTLIFVTRLIVLVAWQMRARGTAAPVIFSTSRGLTAG